MPVASCNLQLSATVLLSLLEPLKQCNMVKHLQPVCTFTSALHHVFQITSTIFNVTRHCLCVKLVMSKLPDTCCSCIQCFPDMHDGILQFNVAVVHTKYTLAELLGCDASTQYSYALSNIYHMTHGKVDMLMAKQVKSRTMLHCNGTCASNRRWPLLNVHCKNVCQHCQQQSL